jgi:hypothetical protein
MTTTDRAVRKASRERLLRDFAHAARFVREVTYVGTPASHERIALHIASQTTSRTRYACLMTAFGK